MRRLLCLMLGHRWFQTVVTHHDVKEPGDAEWFRGEWHERICTRCGQEEAVYQRKLDSWNSILDGHRWKPTTHMMRPGDW